MGLVSYTWNDLNQLKTVTDSHLGTTTYTYDTANNVVTVAYPNGVQSTLNYDQLNRLTSLSTTASTGYLYQFGPAGNRTNATELDGRSINWSYDGIYRLANESISSAPSNVNGSVAYGLDPVGNRLSTTSTVAGINSGAYSFNPDDQELIESYDADGNTTATGSKSFAYDSKDRLKSMNGGAVTITYDGDGNRVAKTVSGVTTRYLVDDLNPTGYAQVVEETGATQRVYTYGLQRIGEYQIINSTWTPSFYNYDGMGSVRQLTNASGAITDTYEYDAFGNLLNKTGTTPNNYLYRGEQWDPDLGLYYLRARYYNPNTGRFMSRDPEDGILTDPSTLHKYIYAGGDPVNAFDPSGRNTLTWPGAPTQATSPTRSAIEYVAIVGTISLGAVEGVKAVTCAINIANTVNALRTPTGSFAGITVNLPGCTASKNCQPFEDAIQRAMGLVLWRYQELLTDRNQLYCKAYDYPWLGKYPNGPGTWLGHLQAFRQAQGELIKAILAANAAGCPIPPQAWELAYMPPPICPAGRIPRP